MSMMLKLLNPYLRMTERPALARMGSAIQARARLERNASRFFHDVPGIRYGSIDLSGDGAVTGQIARPVQSPARTAAMYIHGGGFYFGSSETHRRLGGAIAAASGLDVVLPDYRLVPEHRFPAALEDCQRAYLGLVARGYTRIALIGESAGGGLVFALLAKLVADGAPLPYACVGLSPWVDLTISGDSHQRNAWAEATLPPERMAEAAKRYAGDAALDDPFVSPVFARFAGAPRCLIHVSSAEILEDDTHMLADRLRADGVDVTVRTWDRAPHAWHLYHGMLAEADEAIADIGAFLTAD